MDPPTTAATRDDMDDEDPPPDLHPASHHLLDANPENGIHCPPLNLPLAELSQAGISIRQPRGRPLGSEKVGARIGTEGRWPVGHLVAARKSASNSLVFKHKAARTQRPSALAAQLVASLG